ncbi:MAG: single-stranded-DNA-specific exonuclease RecJ [Flavobacteriaceae bacterium]|nr:MAG: single-stranded-DNA-specific exonuclease RecJ [Flavobacteriaceae bacterium]
MRWTQKKTIDSKIIDQLSNDLGVDKNIATLLAQRGVSSFEQAKSFFRPNLSELHDPFLMKDMDKAVERIAKAIKNEENILVYGDYDVDGTTSVSLVYSYLKTIHKNLATYIPDRYAEGYGISFKSIDFAADNNFSLIIALDCGIKAIDKVKYATEKGIDYVICDHHRPGDEIPKAVAVLDPKRVDCSYPYDELCGCGVGFKLIQAIGTTYHQNIDHFLPYLDLVATAIGADIVPVTGENRILAFHGLKVINSNPRTGMKALIAQSKKENLTITDVVFGIAPRINAAGRIKSGNDAVQLLIEDDIVKAQKFAEAIEINNIDRKELDKSITQEALLQIIENKEQEGYTTVVYDEKWHKGVIGIVASRLIETYYRPTLVFTKSGDKLAASARSVTGFDVYDALEQCSEFIEQFGGHKYAAGLTLSFEQYPKFKAKFEEVVKATIPLELRVPELKYDSEIIFEKITPKFYRILKQLAPFGPGNMTPTFIAKNVRDTGWGKPVGGDKTHLKVNLEDPKTRIAISGIGFGLADTFLKIKKGNQFDVAFTIDENIWQGNTSLQLMLKDLKEGV